MHKLIDVVVKIIEAMASNVYNGVGDRRILKRPTEVHLVEANPSSSFLEQKMYVLTKKIETLMKA